MSSTVFDLNGKSVFVAGEHGMVGSALVRRLSSENVRLISVPRKQIDFRDQAAVVRLFEERRPEVVFVAAAKVGGIVANNTFRAEFIYDNLAIATNLIHTAHQFGVQKLMFLGSSCIYPKFAAQPIREESILTGPLEPTNEPYAIAKIAALKMAEAYRDQYGADFISVMPTNLYGVGDNFHPDHSHVIAGLLRRFHEAKMSRQPSVAVWGTGTPRREFLFVDDMADACVFLMKTYSDRAALNIGTGTDVTIAELASLIAETVGYSGDIVFDTAKPDGTPRKLLDVTALTKAGWTAKTSLAEGMQVAYRAFLQGQQHQQAS